MMSWWPNLYRNNMSFLLWELTTILKQTACMSQTNFLLFCELTWQQCKPPITLLHLVLVVVSFSNILQNTVLFFKFTTNKGFVLNNLKFGLNNHTVM